ncbi:hypothetical protein ACV337_31380, partial [Pseudomonas aeruginosa]
SSADGSGTLPLSAARVRRWASPSSTCGRARRNTATADSTSAALTLLAIGLGLWQKYWALRVALDAELFERFSHVGDRLEAQTQDLDRAPADLGLAPADAAGRTWD